MFFNEGLILFPCRVTIVQLLRRNCLNLAVIIGWHFSHHSGTTAWYTASFLVSWDEYMPWSIHKINQGSNNRPVRSPVTRSMWRSEFMCPSRLSITCMAVPVIRFLRGLIYVVIYHPTVIVRVEVFSVAIDASSHSHRCSNISSSLTLFPKILMAGIFVAVVIAHVRCPVWKVEVLSSSLLR